VLQCVAFTLLRDSGSVSIAPYSRVVRCDLLQCVAMCCSSLQRVAFTRLRVQGECEHCPVQSICVAVCCSALHCVAVYCSVLHLRVPGFRECEHCLLQSSCVL